MNKIIRMWNQNRKKIIIIVLVVAFCFLIIQVLNQMAKEQIKENNNKNKIVSKEENLPSTSIITGEKVKETTTQTNVGIIESFVENCNSNDIEKAYSLLTDGCKEVLFPTKESFINNYYNIIFKEQKTIKIENYKNSSNTNTYQVTFYGDVLSTGNVATSDKYTDYITVEKDSEKLNINSLVTTTKLESEKEVNGIKISVKRKEIYKDYEKFQIKVENNTDKTVLLDTRKSSKTIYAVGTDSIKYSANTNEIGSSLFEIQKYVAKTYEIKFNKRYDSSIRSKKIIFSDIIEDYDKYKQQKTDERLKIEIEF